MARSNKGKKWQSVRCANSGKPYVARPGAEPPAPGKVVGPEKCPRCGRHMFVNERHKWPTHGAYKMSWGYGE